MEPKAGIAQRIAQLITDYLGPSVPRTAVVARPGGATATVPPAVTSAPGAANLTALRSLLDQDPATYNAHPQLVIWKLREALRTEFFKIRYPHPPSARLLYVVTTSEIFFTDYGNNARPFFFPGARVAVPTETGTHRAGTSLQLRFKKAEGRTVTEALLHLDGPDGGGFQWVQAQVLSLLAHYVPVRPVIARPLEPARPPANRGGRGGGRARARGTATAAAGRTARGRARARDSRPTATTAVVTRPPLSGLPAGYLPDALRSTSPPPAKRLRNGVSGPVSLVSGSLRRTLDLWTETPPDGKDDTAPAELQNKIVANTLAVERIIARRQNESLGGVVEYCVKWAGAPLSEASWETRGALMRDVPGEVVAFDTAHPREPVLTHATPKPTPAEETPLIEMDCALNPLRDTEVMDSRAQVPIPKYVDTPLLSLKFAGMELAVREDCKYSFYKNKKEAKADRKERKERFIRDNPVAAAKVYTLDSKEADDDHPMSVAPRVDIPGNQLWGTLLRSAEAHKQNNRRPIPFPRGVGEVLPYAVAPPVPAEHIAMAPASWESYLMSIGMVCTDWERELVPEFPGVAEAVRESVEEAAPKIRMAQLTAGRPKGTRFDFGRVVSTPKPKPMDTDAEGGAVNEKQEPGSTAPEETKAKMDVDGAENGGDAAHDSENDGDESDGSEDDDGKSDGEEGNVEDDGLLRDRNPVFKKALEEAMADAKTRENCSMPAMERTKPVYNALFGFCK